MLDKITRNKVYSQAKLVCRFLYDSPESGGNLYSIAQKYDLHKDEMYKTFAITVGDIILGFYRIEDTVPLLQQELGVSPMVAARLGADVLDFLAPLSDPNWQPPVEEASFDDTDWDANSDYEGESSVAATLTTVGPHTEPTDPAVSLAGTYSVSVRTEETPEQYSPYKPPQEVQRSIDTAVSPVASTAYQPVGAPVSTPAGAAVPPTTLDHHPRTTSPYQHLQNPALHTMASDMAHIRAGTTPSLNLDYDIPYQSQSQDTLRQPLSTTPTYTPAPAPVAPKAPDLDPPRWSGQ